MLEDTPTRALVQREKPNTESPKPKLDNKSTSFDSKTINLFDAILTNTSQTANLLKLLSATRKGIYQGSPVYVTENGTYLTLERTNNLYERLGLTLAPGAATIPTAESVDRLKSQQTEVVTLASDIKNEQKRGIEEKHATQTTINFLEILLLDTSQTTNLLTLLSATRKDTYQRTLVYTTQNGTFLTLERKDNFYERLGLTLAPEAATIPTAESVDRLKSQQAEVVTLASDIKNEQKRGIEEKRATQTSSNFLEILLVNGPEATDIMRLLTAQQKGSYQGTPIYTTENGTFLTLQRGNNLYERLGLTLAPQAATIPTAESVDRLRSQQADIMKLVQRINTFKSRLPLNLQPTFQNIISTFKNPELTIKAQESLQLILQRDNPDLSEEMRQIVGDLVQLNRLLNLKNQFFSLNESNTSTFDQQLAFLNQYETETSQDRTTTQELATFAYQKRRRQDVQTYIQEVKAGRDGFTIITRLESSESPNDRALGNFLRELTYKRILANLRQSISGELAKGLNFSPEAIMALIRAVPLYPKVRDLNFIDELNAIIKNTTEIVTELNTYKLVAQANEIKGAFRSTAPEQIFSRIRGLFNVERQSEVEQGIARSIAEQLTLEFTTFLAAERPDFFADELATDLRNDLAAQVVTRYVEPELGRNKEALRLIGGNFKSVYLPLFQSFRASKKIGPGIDRYLKSETDPKTGKVRRDPRTGEIISRDPKLIYTQRVNDIRARSRRELTPREERYLQSVELLTIMNPHLVAILSQEFSIADTYFKHHFDTLSRRTQETLRDGDYVPLIQIGLGPNGVNAAAELARQNPELLKQTLFIDQGTQPGGPFAIPEGAAWDLNSQNKKEEGVVLPDLPTVDEDKTVRGYGSPFTAYPGERNKGSSVRTNSINTIGSYLPTPDNLSLNQYPTNEELAALCQAQAALLVNRASFNTKVTQVRENPNPSDQGMYLVDLEITQSDGNTRTISVKTDGLVVSSGLGNPTLGFETKGKRAERARVAKTRKGKRIFSSTLEYFNEIASRKAEKEADIGETIVIIGSGNSADVLIEYLGGIFAQGENNAIRNVKKIYIISESDQSKRPRYARISDLKPRNGNDSLVEQVRSRVGDVGFLDDSFDPENPKLVLYDTNGNILTDSKGKPVVADRVVSTAGFRPDSDKVFAPLLESGKTLDLGKGKTGTSAREVLTLPTDKNIPVADTLVNHPNILFVGTASDPNFSEKLSPYALDKLAQLPPLAREALLRNGVENAVALGFRGPDVQAAINIWINERDITLPESAPAEPRPIDIVGSITSIQTPLLVNTEELGLRNDLDSNEDMFLSPLLTYNLTRHADVFGDTTKDTDCEIDLRFDSDRRIFDLKVMSVQSRQPVQSPGGKIRFFDTETGISSELSNLLSNKVLDTDFQRYAISLLNSRRSRDPKLRINLSFKKGKLSPKYSYVEGA